MAITQLNICNMAMGHVGGKRIEDFDNDTTAEAVMCRDNWETCVNYTLESRDWTFARDRDTLEVDATAPSFYWSYRHEQPTDCVMLRKISDDSSYLDKDFEYELEGEWIYSNTNSDIYVVYTKAVTDITLFSAAFVKALVYQLAAVAAGVLAEDPKLADALEAKFNKMVDIAGGLDGVQTRPRIVKAERISRFRNYPGDIYD